MATATDIYARAYRQACGGLDFQTIKVDAEMAFTDADPEELGEALLAAWRASKEARAERKRRQDLRAAAEMRNRRAAR